MNVVAMNLKVTAAHSSRVTKTTAKNPLLRRSSSSPFANLPRKKPSSQTARKPSVAKSGDDNDKDRLEDLGLITALATDLRLRDVAQYLQYIAGKMFDDIPERAGMGSSRIAEVLNFRKNLPPIITVAHVHAISQSPTSTEREIAELVQGGIVRKINIPGRGLGAAAIGDSLVLTDRWVQVVSGSDGLSSDVKEKYIQALHEFPAALSIRPGYFLPHEVVELAKYGLLTTTSISANHPPMLRSDSSAAGTLASLSTVGSRNASGSFAAIGGASAIYDAGGGGVGGGMYSQTSTTTEYHFSLPSVGIYLRLLDAARAHLISLLSKSKYKEAPKDLLRDRWDGSLAGALPPAKTRKWKQFYGMRFEWILEECLGTGLVEIFNTGSVGHGVRLT